jgi:hypothetical protein
MHRLRAAFPFALLLTLSACSLQATTLPSRCEAIDVDPMRELLLTDAPIVTDDRVAFARVAGAVLGDGADEAARVWMDAWSAVPGEDSLRAEVIQPWSLASEIKRPRASSTTPSLDLSRAPFELVAIGNRIDLATLSTAAFARAGEIRFVYGLVTAGERRPLTVVVELQLPPTRSNADWATAWHALGSLEGDAEKAALLAIVDEALASPLRGQVRTQDGRLADPILLEFDFHGGGALAPSRLFNEPAADTSPAALARFVSANQNEVLAGTVVVPSGMLAWSVTAVRPDYELPGVPATAADTFADETCNGCHTRELTLDGTFHVSPLRRGTDAISPFLRSPNGEADELSRRAEVLRGLVCVE